MIFCSDEIYLESSEYVVLKVKPLETREKQSV